jgi:hypothetical protein
MKKSTTTKFGYLEFYNKNLVVSYTVNIRADVYPVITVNNGGSTLHTATITNSDIYTKYPSD